MRRETTLSSSDHPTCKKSRVTATHEDDVKHVGATFYERHVIFASVAPRTQSTAQNQDEFENRYAAARAPTQGFLNLEVHE